MLLFSFWKHYLPASVNIVAEVFRSRGLFRLDWFDKLKERHAAFNILAKYPIGTQCTSNACWLAEDRDLSRSFLWRETNIYIMYIFTYDMVREHFLRMHIPELAIADENIQWTV